MTQIASSDPTLRRTKGSRIKGWRPCLGCGKGFYTQFKYKLCYPCAQSTRDEKAAKKKTDALEINQAILNVAKRKKELGVR